MEIFNDFQNRIASIIGNFCSAVVAGKGSGSVVNLGFGDLIERERHLSNPTLSKIERTHRASCELLIYSSWRVIEDNTISYGWRDAEEQGDYLYSKLKLLVGKKVAKLELNEISKDLFIFFEDGVVFQIFCDITSDYESDDNYVYFMKNDVFSVGVNGRLSVEKNN